MGLVDGELVLADEVLTPDSSRFWRAAAWEPGRPQTSYDKQVLRDWLTSPASGWDRASDTPPPALPHDVVTLTRARVRGTSPTVRVINDTERGGQGIEFLEGVYQVRRAHQQQRDAGRGGSASAAEPTPRERALAVRAAQVLGLGVAGVDLVESARGPLVLEVNASPGLEGVEAVSGVDVAGEIIDFVHAGAARAARPKPRKVRRTPV